MTFLLLSSKAKKTAQCSMCYRNRLQIWASNWSDMRDPFVWPDLGLILHVQALATPQPCLDESQDPTTCLLPLTHSLGFQTGWSEAGAEWCKAPMCHTMWSELQGCPCTGRLPAFSTPHRCKISFWEDSVSHLFLLVLSMLPSLTLPNFRQFIKQFQLTGFSISLIKNAFARSEARPCNQEFPAGQPLSEKKFRFSFGKQSAQKTELCVCVANIFLFISSRIQSRFFSSPKNFILVEIFHGEKANQKHSALAWSSNTWGFSHSPDLGLGNTLASWQSWFTQVAQRHTSYQHNTRQANPPLMISNIDLLKLPFPTNIYFLLAATIWGTYFQGRRFLPFPPWWTSRCPSYDFLRIMFSPFSPRTRPEDRCDLFKQQQHTQHFFTRPDCCKRFILAASLPASNAGRLDREAR